MRIDSKLIVAFLAFALAGCATAKPVDLTCDPVPNAAGYTVYVVANGSTNSITYSSNVFGGVDVPSGGYAACTVTDTNGFESDWSNTLTNSAVKPTNFRKK
jgi:hypothetical protein